jgi:hypothetical protein
MKRIRDKILAVWEVINFTLPSQLLLIQLRRYKTMLLLWVIVIGVVSGAIGKSMGITYLFLEPEYLGRVSFWSLFIMGSALGAFIFSYMITLYINESYRFNFIVLDRNPFFTFSLNNFFLPAVFLCAYFYRYTEYHLLTYGGFSYEMLMRILGMAAGIITVFLIFASYFFATNANIFKAAGESLQRELEKARKGKANRVILGKARQEMRSRNRVDSYLSFPFKWDKTDKPEDLEFRQVVKILNQNHGNLLFLMFSVMLVVAMLGLLENRPHFQIPAGASVLLTFSLFILIAGGVTFWFRKLGGLLFFLLLLFAWWYPHLGFLHERNQAYGLNYQAEAAPFHRARLGELLDEQYLEADHKAHLAMLNQWKDRYQEKYGRSRLPKAVFVSASGGGLRSTCWSLRVMQELDSLTSGEFGPNIRLMTGASGGMLGLAYFRELQMRKIEGDSIDLSDPVYLENASRDLLNRIIYRAFTDIFLPNRKIRIGDKTYDKERGYSFDNQMAMNMPELAGRKLGDYSLPEAEGKIPVMVLTPSIINHSRQLYISSSGVSFLGKTDQITDHFTARSAGVEFRRMFANQDPDSLWFTTALRMNASFPFVLPVVSLPSEPVMEVMDAGAIDNYGTATGIRYLYEFRDWFARNTETVLFVQIRDNQREDPIKDTYHRNALSKAMKPVGGGYNSQTEAKDLAIDQMLSLLKEWYDGKVEIVSFEYPQETTNFPASLSLHLTELEKLNIRASIATPHNLEALETVESLYQSELLVRMQAEYDSR